MSTCPKCKAPIEKNSKFCENCGFEITEPNFSQKRKFKLTKKVTVLSSLAIMLVMIIATVSMNNAALNREKKETDLYVAYREAQIMHEISLFEEMKEVADSALNEIDVLTDAIIQRDNHFRKNVQLPGTILLEGPTAIDEYYIPYVNDYIMENYAQSYANLVKQVDRFNELYDKMDRELLSEYALLDSMGFNACGFKICINKFNEAIQNKEPYSVIEDSDYAPDIDCLAEIYKLDVLSCYEGLFDFYQKLNADVLSSQLIFDFE